MEGTNFPSARLRDTKVSMTKQETMVSKKRGPAPTGQGTPVMVRLQPIVLSTLDAWIEKQPDRPSRPEAIRRLVTKGLSEHPGQ